VWGRSGTTPFVRWGNYAFLALAAAMIAITVLMAQRTRRQKS
jgi:apolipoprotein N-acyltransferase